MQARFQALLHVIENIPDKLPRNLLEALRTLPPVGALPSAPSTWLLLAVFQYRERQRWAKEFVREHVPEAVPPSDRLLRLFELDQPLEMALPGLSEWQVNLECENGWGNLIHRTTQEMVTFGLTRKDREVILFLDHFHDYVKPVSRWEPTGRALELNFPDGGIWQAIEDLVAARILDPIDYDGAPFDPSLGDGVHRLNRYLATRYAVPMLRFCQQWDDADRRLWLASVIGDWPLAHELAQVTNDANLIAFTGQRDKESRTLQSEMAAQIKQARNWAYADSASGE